MNKDKILKVLLLVSVYGLMFVASIFVHEGVHYIQVSGSPVVKYEGMVWDHVANEGEGVSLWNQSVPAGSRVIMMNLTPRENVTEEQAAYFNGVTMPEWENEAYGVQLIFVFVSEFVAFRVIFKDKPKPKALSQPAANIS